MLRKKLNILICLLFPAQYSILEIDIILCKITKLMNQKYEKL